MSSARILIAGTHSGCGKTTVTLGLLSALRRRGLRVQAFKSGPDYIDPGHHALVTGRPGRNLDTWMLPDAAVQELFLRAAADADICVTEAAMGLYDGYGAREARGSAAHLARLLDCPVLLVLDAKGMGRSAAAMALGYCRFDPAVRICGFVLNNVAGESHFSYLRPEIEATLNLPVLGYVPRNPALRVGERHLGLEPADEGGLTTGAQEALTAEIEAHVDLERLTALAGTAPGSVGASPSASGASLVFSGPAREKRVRVAVARDRAFHFYYQDNLDLLEHLGAVCVPFSPMTDRELPAGVHLLYLGGGYPEVYAEALAENHSMRTAIHRWAEAGRPIYAECGSLMYLGESLVPLDGREYPMAGVLPVCTRMQNRRVALGYTTVTFQRDCLLGPAGTQARAHEFHWSALEELGPVEYAYHSEKRPGVVKLDGLVRGQVLAAYAHLHFAAHPPLAEALVAAALRERER